MSLTTGRRPPWKVIWSQVRVRKPGPKGEWQLDYQSGLTFRCLKPEQRAGVTAALKILTATQEG